MRPIEQPELGAAPEGTFGDDEIAGLPAIVQRFFRTSIAPGARLVPAVSLRMRGEIKVRRWLPFEAVQVLHPLRGFTWRVRVATGWSPASTAVCTVQARCG